MRSLFTAAVVAFAATAWANEPAHEAGHGGAEEENPPISEFIFHHVSDSNEYEFEIPLNRGHNPVIHLPKILVPLKAGACEGVDVGQASLKQGCLDLSITKHTVAMWLSAILLVAVILIWANRDQSKLVARGTGANLIEALVVWVRDELAIKNIGKEEGPRYTPYLLSIFFFILTMNLFGLFPWMATATGNLAVTCGLALCTFVLTQAASIRAAGFWGYLKHLTGGVPAYLWPVMIPVEILGLFTKPFALTVRLFANMLAGHVVIFFLISLIFMLHHPAVAVISVPFALGIYFLELFVAFLQSYVFTMLSALFIGMGVAMGHHGHEEPGHAAAH